MKEDWQYFFNNVKIKLGLYDWNLKYDSVPKEGYCWGQIKKLLLGKK